MSEGEEFRGAVFLLPDVERAADEISNIADQYNYGDRKSVFLRCLGQRLYELADECQPAAHGNEREGS